MNDKENKDKRLYVQIKKIYDANYQKYGSPRITIAINNQIYGTLDIRINHKRIERIGKTAPNVLNRNFEATGPYQKLGTDLTVFITNYGKVYLSPIIDFYTREILAYDLSETPDYRQITRMLENLENKHKDMLSGAIIHSDQGWQYQMPKYREKLKELSITQSMSRKGNCLDNSPTENFFGRMKEEMFYGKEHLYNNMESLKAAIKEYISYYNSKRIVFKLKMSPIEYRTKHQTI